MSCRFKGAVVVRPNDRPVGLGIDFNSSTRKLDAGLGRSKGGGPTSVLGGMMSCENCSPVLKYFRSSSTNPGIPCGASEKECQSGISNVFRVDWCNRRKSSMVSSSSLLISSIVPGINVEVTRRKEERRGKKGVAVDVLPNAVWGCPFGESIWR